MKEEFRRQRQLTHLRAPLSALEPLCRKVEATVSGLTLIRHLELDAGDRSLQLDSLEELRESVALPARLKGVKIILVFHRQGGTTPHRSFHLGLYRHRSEVLVTGEDEAWCAGVLDLALRFAKQHRTWYSGVSEAAFLLPYGALITVVGWAIIRFLSGGLAVVGVVLFFVASLMLGAYHRNFFPSSVITTAEQENFLRKHQPELVAAGAIIAAAAAILALIF